MQAAISDRNDDATWDADAVGLELVRQYYTVLTGAPEHLWRFYAERGDYGDCWPDRRPAAVTVDAVCAARCSGRGLLVSVTGAATAADAPREPPRPFAQSFVAELRTEVSFAVVATTVAFARRQWTRPLPEDPADRQLFVGRLTSATSDAHLENTFGKYGRVVGARVLRGRGRHNYAFVRFADPRAVDAVLADLPVTLCNGHPVNVQRSKQQRRRRPKPRRVHYGDGNTFYS